MKRQCKNDKRLKEIVPSIYLFPFHILSHRFKLNSFQLITIFNFRR